ncbi:hypothetical protein [Paenibacillus sp. JNUCC31]|uniref:hypothetical protein n=1 Tax=Paenibacillus sp. JNUCC-31 TaxID=2777983 RepID=UPI001E5EFCEF|nr:hypothetical protein [Paenibacillus sp. JNUCC-31]
MEYDEFYNYLVIYSENYLQEHPQEKEGIVNLLDVVRNRLNLMKRTDDNLDCTKTVSELHQLINQDWSKLDQAELITKREAVDSLSN